MPYRSFTIRIRIIENVKEPRYSTWGKILEFSGLAWWKVKPIDWSRLKRKKPKITK